MIIPPHDPTYPRRLLDIEEPPVLDVSAPLEEPPRDRVRMVAIVGSREAAMDACNWTHQLAYHLAKQEIVVVSGGAKGIDAAAHEGALKAGATWCIACNGRDAAPFPPKNDGLFRAIAQSRSSRMIWPFPPRTEKTRMTPRDRNRVLVGLADAVVVVQAKIDSGSMNAASNAVRFDRPMYVVTGRPWDYPFRGSTKLILEGAAPLLTIEQLFVDLDLDPPDLDDPDGVLCDRAPQQAPIRTFKRRARSLAPDPQLTVDLEALDPSEKTVFLALSRAPAHQDKIVANCGLGTSSTLTALLTLSLKDVVVEGPDGFFRVRTGP